MDQGGDDRGDGGRTLSPSGYGALVLLSMIFCAPSSLRFRYEHVQESLMRTIVGEIEHTTEI